MNSNGSSSIGIRTRRAPSVAAPRRTASRRATSGSCTFDPQPGWCSGSWSSSRTISGVAAPQAWAANRVSSSRSRLTNPSKLKSTCRGSPASTSAGTASNPYSAETSSVVSSATAKLSSCRSTKPVVWAGASCETPTTRSPSAASAPCSRSTRGAVRSHVAQSCLKKKSRVAGADDSPSPNASGVPFRSLRAKAGASAPAIGKSDMISDALRRQRAVGHRLGGHSR